MRGALIQAVAIALLAAVPALLSAVFHPKRPDFSDALKEGEIAVRVASRDAAQFFWIEARALHEYAEQHVPGAVPLNEDDWDSLLPAVMQNWPAGKPAVVYCSARQCDAARNVARRLREFNTAPVFELKGGWEAWLALRKK